MTSNATPNTTPAAASAVTRGQVLYDASDALVLTRQAQQALADAEITVDSDMLLAIAADDLKAVKALQHRVEHKRTAITRPLNQALKAVNELFRAPKDYLEQAERSLKAAILAYTTAQEKALAEARREAEALARVEREQLAAQQREQERVALQAQEAGQAALREAQAAAAAGDAPAAAAAQEKASQCVEAAERALDAASAAAYTAEVVTMPVVANEPPRLAGVVGRVTYSAVVDDLPALVRAVAEGAAPLQCLCADERFLAAQARAFRKAGPLYPGVSAVAERSLAAARSTT